MDFRKIIGLNGISKHAQNGMVGRILKTLDKQKLKWILRRKVELKVQRLFLKGD